jgi:hypothetical protein
MWTNCDKYIIWKNIQIQTNTYLKLLEGKDRMDREILK